MGSLYGNIISHIPRSQFEISKIYQSRVDMETNIVDDNVAQYQYVLVKYGEPGAEYSGNLAKDQDAYGNVNNGKDYVVNYDQTVWQKQFDNNDNKYYYRAIDRIHSILPTFQDMSARNLVVEGDNSLEYEGFGIEYLYGYYYSYDQESADIFNERYKDSEIQIEVDENGTWNGEQVKNKIEIKIEELSINIDDKKQILNDQSSDIDNNQVVLDEYYNNIIEQYNNLFSTYSALVIPDNTDIVEKIENNIEIINSNLEQEIKSDQSSLSELYNDLNNEQKNELNTLLSNLKEYEKALEAQQNLLSEIEAPKSARETLQSFVADFVVINNNLLSTLTNHLSETSTYIQATKDVINDLLEIANQNLEVEEESTKTLAQTIVSYIEDENKFNDQIAMVEDKLNEVVETDVRSIQNNMDSLDNGLEEQIDIAETEEKNLIQEIAEISSITDDIKTAINQDVEEISILLNDIITNIANSITLINNINKLYENNLSLENETLELLNQYGTNLNEYENKITEIYNLITNMFAIVDNDLDYDIFETIFYYLDNTQNLLLNYQNTSLDLIKLEDSKSYYEEMLNWFNNFTNNMTESFVYEMPRKVLSYATDTIEYPMK